MGIINLRKKGAAPSTYITRLAKPVLQNKRNIELYAGWIYACTQVRAEAVAKTEFVLYEVKANGEVERVLKHPVLDLLYKVNDRTTKFDFLELISTYRDIYGNAPIYLDFDGKPQPKNMYILNPVGLKCKRDVDGTVIGYEYRMGNYYKTFLPHEVIELKNYNPADTDKGYSPLDALFEIAKQDDYMTQANEQLLKNSGVPSGLIKAQTDNKEEIDAIRQQFNAKYSGYDNFGETIVLSEGLDYQPLAIKPSDMQFIEARNFNKSEILSVFRVPKELLGDTQTANRASAEAIQYAFNKNTIEPIVQKMVEQLNEFLIPLFSNNLYLSYEPLSTEDKTAQISNITALINAKVITPNEARAELGYDAIEGGDIIYAETGDAEVKSINILKKKEADLIRTKVYNRNARRDALAHKISEKITNGITDKIKDGKIKLSVKTSPEKHIKLLKGTNTKGKINARNRKKFQEETLKEQDEQEVKFKREIQRYFQRQYEVLKDNVELNFKSAEPFLDIDRQQEAYTLMEVIEPIYFESVMRGVEGAEKYFAPKGYKKPEYKNLKMWITRTAKKWAEEITETTIKELTDVIIKGKEEGQSMQQVMEALQGVYKDMTDNRAMTIARTETARAYDEAHAQAYQEMGYYKMEYLVAPDCCEECQENANKEWNIDNIAGVVPVHPNCRCDFAPKL